MDSARGLTHLHKNERPVIHRNIKPSNILLDTVGLLACLYVFLQDPLILCLFFVFGLVLWRFFILKILSEKGSCDSFIYSYLEMKWAKLFSGIKFFVMMKIRAWFLFIHNAARFIVSLIETHFYVFVDAIRPLLPLMKNILLVFDMLVAWSCALPFLFPFSFHS